MSWASESTGGGHGLRVERVVLEHLAIFYARAEISGGRKMDLLQVIFSIHYQFFRDRFVQTVVSSLNKDKRYRRAIIQL